MPTSINTRWYFTGSPIEESSESDVIAAFTVPGTSDVVLQPTQVREPFMPTKYVPVKEELLDNLAMLIGMGEVVKGIDARVKTLENRMSMMEQKYAELTKELPKKAVIETVEIPKKEAKKAILKLFEQKKEIDYDAIVSELGLDLELVVEICSELEKEKIITEIK